MALMDKVEEFREKARAKASEVRVKAGLEPEPVFFSKEPITERIKSFREKRMAGAAATTPPSPEPTGNRHRVAAPKMIV
ncbi:MAG: hypothetical protein Q8J68_07900 [Methanolobus sp.]|uniref:hypothetical protein n=1 Tax=Methanolobus sp. TaxID=1874737 RepID=UPI002731985E|nr:hypothetical protein [Methanolobus sp.]MDP2217191.1 hypothetical protein [Methanolobus sp.]